MDTQATSTPQKEERPKRDPYPSDLTDEQWEVLEPLVTRTEGPGAPTEVDLREIINTLLYILRTGCQWRFVPHDLVQGSIVRYYKKKWRKDGTWMRINDILRKKVRTAAGRDPEPSVGIIDSQTAKTTESGGESGYDGGKKLKGRKRHILVDILGLLMGVMVHSAGIQEREGAEWLLAKLKDKFPRLAKVFADQGYDGKDFVELIKKTFGLDLEVVKKAPEQEGFVVLAKRWVVERSFAWYSRNRRLSKDYEQSSESSEDWIYLASIHLMLKRLCPATGTRKPYAKSAKALTCAA